MITVTPSSIEKSVLVDITKIVELNVQSTGTSYLVELTGVDPYVTLSVDGVTFVNKLELGNLEDESVTVHVRIHSDTAVDVTDNVVVNWYDEPIIMTWRTTSDNETITIPLFEFEYAQMFLYDFDINWGDGSSESYYRASGGEPLSHQYTTAGDYVVVITGICKGFQFHRRGTPGSGYKGTPTKLIRVDALGAEFGTGGLHSGMFKGCTNLEYVCDMSHISLTEAPFMFEFCEKLQAPPNLNIVSGSTRALFKDCKKIKYLTDVDVANSTAMWDFARGCTDLLEIVVHANNAANWTSCCAECTKLKKAHLSTLDKGTEVFHLQNLFFKSSDIEDVRVLNANRDIHFASYDSWFPLAAWKADKLSKEAREQIYHDLATVTSRTIAMPPSVGEDDSIATSKGWTVSRPWP